MNSLIQLKSKIISSEFDLVSLSDAEQATLLVISDSHGNKPLVSQIIRDFGFKSDALIFCGDGVSDVFSFIDETMTRTDLQRSLPSAAIFVQGNNDSDIYPVEFDPGKSNDGLFYHEIVVPKTVTVNICSHNVLVTHGHRNGVYYSTDELEKEMAKQDVSIAFYGHTHIAKKTFNASSFLLNPGSCSLPRGGLPPSFAVVELFAKNIEPNVVFYKIEFSNGRIEYVPFEPRSVRMW